MQSTSVWRKRLLTPAAGVPRLDPGGTVRASGERPVYAVPMKKSNMRPYVQQCLQLLLEHATAESEKILRQLNTVCPMVFTVRDGFLFVHAPALVGKPQSMEDFVATSKLVCVSQDVEAAVMVTNGRIEPDVQDSDCSIPSVTDREYLWFFGEGKHGIRKNQVLSVERDSDGRFTGLGQALGVTHEPFPAVQLLPATPPTRESRDHATAMLQAYGFRLTFPPDSNESPSQN